MLQVDSELESFYRDKIANLLNNGECIQNITNTTNTTVIKDSDGNVLRTIEKSQETRRTTILPTPAYVMDLIAKSMSSQNAIDFLINQGYLVIDPTKKVEKSDKTKAFTKDAANQIKARILGLKEKTN